GYNPKPHAAALAHKRANSPKGYEASGGSTLPRIAQSPAVTCGGAIKNDDEMGLFSTLAKRPASVHPSSTF
ncbi:MAG: hypothetical protein VB104_06230, partial [Candidatus Limiplasma sp.]|nr:hypothetical protein [Candidatus Limiplasma sp.]